LVTVARDGITENGYESQELLLLVTVDRDGITEIGYESQELLLLVIVARDGIINKLDIERLFFC
jgi:hypothetical protein